MLKLRFPPFETLTRSQTAATPLAFADDIAPIAVALFDDAWRAAGQRPVRLLGVGVTGLRERAQQLRLGESPRRREVAETLMRLREQYGHDAIRRAAEIAPVDYRGTSGSIDGETP